MSDGPSSALLRISDLRVTLGHGARATQVLHGVNLSVPRGSIVALVGESGSGKSTIAKTIIGLHRAESGVIEFDEEPLNLAGRHARRAALRRLIQLIPQDPYSSLDPRRTVGQTLAEAIDPSRARVRSHRDPILRALDSVALDAAAIDRYPHEFSGGQRQRIAIARALVTEPKLIIADEITSALDVSTQAEILGLLKRLRAELGLTMLFITHNLAVVSELCDEAVVLLHGDVVESGPVGRVFSAPASKYTRRLIDSVPGGPAFSLEAAADV